LHAAAALDPRDVGRQTELATIYRQQHRFAEAAEVLDRALALEPDNFELQRARAELDLLGSADLRRMQEVATGAAKSAPSDQGALFRMQTALAQRDYAAAQEALAACRLREINQAAGFVVPREYYEGLIADGLGNSEQARASFLAARERAAARVAARSTEGIAFSVLGQIEARLGHKEEALRQAERGVELYEASGDELQKGSSIIRLAAICSRVGESDRALDLLEKRAKLPNGPTYGLLRLNPDWDPLRSHPRFEKLVASLAPKNAPPAR
jgi:tetratricopeptide (TPR) repeat protein